MCHARWKTSISPSHTSKPARISRTWAVSTCPIRCRVGGGSRFEGQECRRGRSCQSSNVFEKLSCPFAPQSPMLLRLAVLSTLQSLARQPRAYRYPCSHLFDVCFVG